MSVETQDAVTRISAETRRDFAVLTSGCGIYNLERVQIALTGEDRVRWLNGMVTNNTRDLAAGHGIYAFLLNPQGKIQADLYTFNRGESLIVETEASLAEKVLGIFDRYIIMDDVEVENRGRKVDVIGLMGPGSKKVLNDVGLGDHDLQPLQFADVKWREHPVTIVRGDNPAIEAYELWIASDQAAELREACVQAGATEVRNEALEVVRVLSGVPKYGQDIRDRDLPQETGQERALNFNKGCYVGQEIVERIRSRGAVHRMFTGFEIDGIVPVPGAKIQSEGKDVGEITSTAFVPMKDAERSVGLGYLRKEFAGKELTAGESRLRVAKLPLTELLNT